MNRRNIEILSLAAAVAAVAAWIGLFAYATWVMELVDVSRGKEADVKSITAREMEIARLGALSRDTKALRLQLDDIANSDVIDIANIIENVGKRSGAKLKIGGATREYLPMEKKEPELNAVSFVVEAEGTFESLMLTAKLLETLPVPSSVQAFEFERLPYTARPVSSKTAEWHLTARIRAYTAAEISS